MSRHIVWALCALVCGALQIGCGGSKARTPDDGASRSTAVTNTSTSVHPDDVSQAAAMALAACRGVVEKTAHVSAAGKREIAGLCDEIIKGVKEKERTIRAVCQELATAASTSGDASAARRTFSACQAAYAKAIR